MESEPAIDRNKLSSYCNQRPLRSVSSGDRVHFEKRVVAWMESSCPSDCGKVWGDVGYYHRIQRPPPPQTIPQSLGQLLSTQAIIHFLSGLWQINENITGLSHLRPSCYPVSRALEVVTVAGLGCRFLC